MPKKQKRDSAYYEERLKNEFPLVYGKPPVKAAGQAA